MSEHILIVDDDPAILDSIQEYLSIAGYATCTASNAEKALELLKQRPIDVMISDIIMNGMDGLQLTEYVKKNYDTGIIIMTGYIGDYTYAEAIHKGADDFVFKPIKFDELFLRLKRVIRERRSAQERSQMMEKLKRLSITDDLTQLYNSRQFYHQVAAEVKRYNRYQRPLSLLMIDIDHFKQFNDTYGHLEGDQILSKIGGLITSGLRTMDTAYRYGGEEFTVILPETDANAAVTVAQRIKDAVEKTNLTSNSKGTITLSIGVTEYKNGETVSDFIKRADQAMYASKGKGRDCISLLLPEPSARQREPS